MTSFSLRLPDDLKERAAAQAEAERYFAVRAARGVPGRAREILGRVGRGRAPAEGDEAPD